MIVDLPSGVWGWPWHGLIQGGLIDGARPHPQPPRCDCWLIDMGLPAIELTAELAAVSAAQGWEWRNYALVSGGYLYGTYLGPRAFIHVDQAGVPWLVDVLPGGGTSWQASIHFSVGDLVVYDDQLYICQIAHLSGLSWPGLSGGFWSLSSDGWAVRLSIRRFGLFGFGLATARQVDLSISCESLPGGNTWEDELHDVCTNGRRALIGVASIGNLYERYLSSVIELEIDGVGGADGSGLVVSGQEVIARSSLVVNGGVDHPSMPIVGPGQNMPTPALSNPVPTGFMRAWLAFADPPPQCSGGEGGGGYFAIWHDPLDLITNLGVGGLPYRPASSGFRRRCRSAHYTSAGVIDAFFLEWLSASGYEISGGAVSGGAFNMVCTLPSGHVFDGRIEAGYHLVVASWSMDRVAITRLDGEVIDSLSRRREYVQWREWVDYYDAAMHDGSAGWTPSVETSEGVSSDSGYYLEGSLAGHLSDPHYQPSQTDYFSLESAFTSSGQAAATAIGPTIGGRNLGIQRIDAHAIAFFLRDPDTGAMKWGNVGSPIGTIPAPGDTTTGLWFCAQPKTGDYTLGVVQSCYV